VHSILPGTSVGFSVGSVGFSVGFGKIESVFGRFFALRSGRSTSGRLLPQGRKKAERLVCI